MRLPLVLTLALAVCCAGASAQQKAFAPTARLGNIMYVGDSITHGFGSASYRWPLFKIWADNGIAHRAVGVNRGNGRGGVPLEVPYGGTTFHNIHSAMSSERAYEISGRENRSGRLGNSNIHDWLGLDKSYNGTYRINTQTDMPDAFILLIGTNDTLSDAGHAGIHSCLSEKTQNLLGQRRGKSWKRGGDLHGIISAMRKANAKARIAVCTIPTWVDGRNNNDTAEDLAAIARYNEELKSWARAHGVALVDVNRGLINIARSEDKPFVGVASMFVRDRLHPSPQGDLIIAGNIAQQLGYAGRTAGLLRKAASRFPQQSAERTRAASGETLSLSASGSAGQEASVEFRCTLGNGVEGGWDDAKPMQVELTTTAATGTLCLGESCISWNGQVLYSADMSKLTAPIRLVHRSADPARHIPGGFYVWLGDMLIGEALQGNPSTAPAGLRLRIGQSPVASLRFSYDPTAAWAPVSKRFSVKPPAIK